MALTEEQKKNIKNLRPRVSPASTQTLAARKSGAEPVRMQPALRESQEKMKYPTFGVTAGKDLASKVFAPAVTAFKGAKKIMEPVSDVIGAGVDKSIAGAKARRAIVEGMQPIESQGRSQDSMAVEALKAHEGGGVSDVAAEQGVEVGTEGADMTAGAPHITAGDWRGNYKNKMGDPEQIGGYEVSNLNQSPEAMERFSRQPTAPPQQRVSRGHPLFQENRPEGGWSPDYQRSWNKRKESIEPPRSIGDLIRYKREVAERNRMMDYGDKSRRTDILDREAGQRTGIAQMKASGDAQRQSADDARQAEYDDPSTTPERRKDLERSMAYRAGKPMQEKAPEPRKGVYVEEWNPATKRMEQVLKDPWLGATGGGAKEQPQLPWAAGSKVRQSSPPHQVSRWYGTANHGLLLNSRGFYVI